MPNDAFQKRIDDEPKLLVMIQACVAVCDQLLDKLEHKVTTPESLQIVFEIIFDRTKEAVDSLAILETEAKHNATRDSAILVRVIFDLFIQFEFILKSPVDRAQAFIDFTKIEQFEWLEAMKAYGGHMYSELQKSSTWTVDEARMIAEKDQVAHQFLNKKLKLVSHWYSGSLRDLAKDVGRETEYLLVTQLLSPYVHSSSIIMGKARMHSGDMYQCGLRLLLRLTCEIARYTGVILDDVEREAHHFANQPLFG